MRPTSVRLRVESLESREVPASPAAAPSLGPAPPASANVLWVSTVQQLQSAVQNLQSDQTIVVQPGNYQITAPLYIGLSRPVHNVTVRGATDDFNDVLIRGAGMDNSQVAYGFGVYNAQDVTIADLSVGAVYYDAVDLKGDAGAARVRLYHDRLFDTGEQVIKSNPGNGVGANDCTVEYCVLEYTNGPSTVDHGGGTGYTNGISAHTVSGWQVRNNLFRNFHTPDTAANLWNPAVLMWNHSQGTVVEGNTFIDCDRAVALGLIDQASGTDHQGGAVRNNFVYQRPGLFSAARRAGSDGQIVVYDSPGTQVYHNTVLTNGNCVYSVEVRWANTGVVFSNNLADTPLHARDGGAYTGSGNYLSATPALFVNAAAADFHLVDSAATRANVIDRAVALAAATTDFDLAPRPAGAAADIGADEYTAPPRVEAVTVDDGSIQRSRVGSLTVTFSAVVTLPANPALAFRLTRTGPGTPAGDVVLAVDLTGSTATRTVARLTFSGPLAAAGSLIDGSYTLTVLAAQVTANGQALDGDGDGQPGGDATLAFHRLFGDSNGDRKVDALDLFAFAGAFGKKRGDAGYLDAFDSNGDGSVDALDLFAFAGNFGTTLP